MYEFHFDRQDVDLMLKLVREAREKDRFDHILVALEKNLEEEWDYY